MRDSWKGVDKPAGKAAKAAMSELRKIVDDKITDQRTTWDGHPAALDVAAWAHLEQGITAELRAAVKRARGQGATWQNIADVFGTTRSAAQKRFGEGEQ